MSSASDTPMSRGSRVQPPHAGMMPSFVSGRPIFVAASGVAMRQSHASAISQPPPSATPWIAATVGQGSSAMRVKTCWPSVMKSLSSSGLILRIE